MVGGGGKAEQKAEQKAAEKGGGGKLKAKGKRISGLARPLATPAGLPSVGQPDAYGAGEFSP